ncbi:hypothetical protein [Streptomyces sp. NPDC058330]|uniref:hypothetical protein n=1 Tax=Streptomyces sp. NPDC058330 TaxID=3346449 RepID=UPI0036E93B69
MSTRLIVTFVRVAFRDMTRVALMLAPVDPFFAEMSTSARGAVAVGEAAAESFASLSGASLHEVREKAPTSSATVTEAGRERRRARPGRVNAVLT